MSDRHVPIVHHHAEVVCRRAVRTGNDQIVQLAVIKADAALHHIVPAGCAGLRALETNHRLAVSRDGRQLLTSLRTPGAVITRLQALNTRLFAHGFHFLGAAVAVISMTVFQQLGDDLAVTIHALHLVERTFVRIQAQPLHAIQNALDGLGGGALQIRILNTQHKSALMMTGKSPGE